MRTQSTAEQRANRLWSDPPDIEPAESDPIGGGAIVLAIAGATAIGAVIGVILTVLLVPLLAAP